MIFMTGIPDGSNFTITDLKVIKLTSIFFETIKSIHVNPLLIAETNIEVHLALIETYKSHD
jgi:hypothetical protein